MISHSPSRTSSKYIMYNSHEKLRLKSRIQGKSHDEDQKKVFLSATKGKLPISEHPVSYRSLMRTSFVGNYPCG